MAGYMSHRSILLSAGSRGQIHEIYKKLFMENECSKVF